MTTTLLAQRRCRFDRGFRSGDRPAPVGTQFHLYAPDIIAPHSPARTPSFAAPPDTNN